MPRDVIVVVKTDAKPRPSEALDILLVHTNGYKPLTTYRGLEEVESDYPTTSPVYRKIAALFDQGKTTLATSLMRKVKIAGFPAPSPGLDEEEAADYLITKIEELRNIDDDWYILITTDTSDAINTALAKWAEDTEPTEAELGAGTEDHRKMYFFQTSNRSLSINNHRTVGIYTTNLDEHADAAFLGNVGPFYPQSVTWKFKRPQGVSFPQLTEAQKNQLDENHLNYVTREYKREYVKEGVCTDGEYIDVQMGADWIALNMREAIYDVVLSNGKIPYSDAGFALILSAIYSTLNRAVELRIISLDPMTDRGVYNVSTPGRREATDDQARERRMPDITWEAQLDGAVHKVKAKGTLRATLSL